MEWGCEKKEMYTVPGMETKIVREIGNIGKMRKRKRINKEYIRPSEGSQVYITSMSAKSGERDS